MKKVALLVIMLCSSLGSLAQMCPTTVLTSPEDGDTDVPVNTTISWEGVDGVPGYLISLGTTPDGIDLLDNRNVGNATSYLPPLGLPDDTEIYVTITLFFFSGISPITCGTESFRTVAVTTPPGCATLRNPVDGATGVNIGTNVSWNYVPTATGYFISLGTAPGLDDIEPNQNIGNTLSYLPPMDFPVNTTIYVNITPYNDIGPATSCPDQSFTTGDLGTLPGCTTMISPPDGANNVPLTPNLEWLDIAEATGYLVNIGTTPTTSDVLEDAIFTTNSTFVLNFEPNATYFITIVPFSDAGEAIGCTQETFSTILGCGPFFNEFGELVDLRPEIDFPDLFAFCSDELPLSLSSTDTAEGYRWFQIDNFGNESLISDTADVLVESTGNYRYEAYNIISQSGASIECVAEQPFEVTISSPATITNVRLFELPNGTRIEIEAEGPGDYEYALNNIDGPYQDSNVFETSAEFLYTIYVRDKNGCGISQELVEQDLTLQGFPKFFTPNGDGINDFWQFITPEALTENPLEVIFIFDRYGKLLVQIDPFSQGWDGNFNGGPLPSTDYWFRARLINAREVNGHFALKR
ncbi:MAG: T9SS type B sorting domain-containing protein [Flavobacteriaceae bacterium]